MNNEQFTHMVQQYERLVYTICYQFTKDHPLAEDLAQETFLAAPPRRLPCRPLQALARPHCHEQGQGLFEKRLPPTGAGRRGRRHGRAGRAARHRPRGCDHRPGQRPAHRARDPGAERTRIIWCRCCIFLEENSIDEIARRLERPPKTVHTQLYRAKQLLKNALERGRADMELFLENGHLTDEAPARLIGRHFGRDGAAGSG